jgi:imidazolonepropionase
MNMGATLFGLTPEECLAGMTRNAARALGLDRECGILKEGLAADLAVWSIDHPAELSYWIGHPGPDTLYIGGVAIEEH